jgi:hypothetical protein
MSLVDFVTGRGNAVLFYYDLPDLDLNFEYRKTFPVFPGLNAGFFGQIKVMSDFDFGFDTLGLRQWMVTGFDMAEFGLIFNGFYLDDHGQENTAADVDEITLKAGIGATASLGMGGLSEAGVKGGIEAQIGFDLNDKETEFLNDLPVGDGKLYGLEMIERISHGPPCLFNMQGDLSAFLEAFFWVGIDMGFTTITLFEISERFVDEVIAEFDWECIHQAPKDIAQLDDGTLTLSYQGADSDGQYTYIADVLPINEDLTLESFMKKGFVDTEYYTRADEQLLSGQLAALRQNPGDGEVIVVSTGLRAKVFLASQVEKLVSTGTPMADRYMLKRLNGRVNDIQISTGGEADMIELIGDAKNSTTLSSLEIDGQGGDDYITVDSNMLGPVIDGTMPYQLFGGAGNDRVKLTGKNRSYAGVLLDGGSGDDVIFGGQGIDYVAGGRGMDVIATYGGADAIYGGDEFEETDLALYADASGKTQVSTIYRADGTPFAEYDPYGRPVSGGQPIVLTPGNHKMRFFHGDVIDAGAGNDTVYGGHGYDQIIGGAGFNTIYGDEGNDVIDAGTGPAEVHGGSGADTITWAYAPLTGSGLTIYGDGGEDTLDVTVDDNPNTITLERDASDPNTPARALLSIDGDTVTLAAVEHLKLDAKQNGDAVTIDDLMDTSMMSVDLQLGSRKATMWQADRAFGGQYQVYPADYGAFGNDPSVLQSAYFYRYDLAEGGQYLFNEDGSPRLQEVVTGAEIDEAEDNNSLQSVWLAEGLHRVNLFYGYDESAPQKGRTAENSVEVHAGMSEMEMESALESIGAVTDVAVTGSGTQADPWKIQFLVATTGSDNHYKRLAHHYDVEAYVGKLASRDDTRVFQRFYRLTDPEAEYLFNNDGSPDLISKSEAAAAVEHNQVQLVALNSWEDSAILWYGDEGIAVERGITAAELEQRLQWMSGVADVAVTGSGTEADPWQLFFSAEATAKLSGDVVTDDIWKLVIDQGLATEVSVAYQVQSTDSSPADVAAGLAASLNASPEATTMEWPLPFPATSHRPRMVAQPSKMLSMPRWTAATIPISWNW